VVFGVRLGRLFRVMLGVDVMRVSEMRMMSGVFVLAVAMMLGGLTMMLGSFDVMVRRAGVMLGGALGVLHGLSPRYAPIRRAATMRGLCDGTAKDLWRNDCARSA
jgi:hypothetical protein